LLLLHLPQQSQHLLLPPQPLLQRPLPMQPLPQPLLLLQHLPQSKSLKKRSSDPLTAFQPQKSRFTAAFL
jgi:hypothetical protein